MRSAESDLESAIRRLGHEVVEQLSDSSRILKRHEVRRLTDYRWVESSITWDFHARSGLAVLSTVPKRGTSRVHQGLADGSGNGIVLPAAADWKAAGYAALLYALWSDPDGSMTDGETDGLRLEALVRTIAFGNPTEAFAALRAFEGDGVLPDPGTHSGPISRTEAGAHVLRAAGQLANRGLRPRASGIGGSARGDALQAVGVSAFQWLGHLLAHRMVFWATIDAPAGTTTSLCWSYREAIYRADRLPWRTALGWKPIPFHIDLSDVDAENYVFEFQSESPVEVSRAEILGSRFDASKEEVAPAHRLGTFVSLAAQPGGAVGAGTAYLELRLEKRGFVSGAWLIAWAVTSILATLAIFPREAVFNGQNATALALLIPATAAALLAAATPTAVAMVALARQVLAATIGLIFVAALALVITLPELSPGEVAALRWYWGVLAAIASVAAILLTITRFARRRPIAAGRDDVE